MEELKRMEEILTLLKLKGAKKVAKELINTFGTVEDVLSNNIGDLGYVEEYKALSRLCVINKELYKDKVKNMAIDIKGKNDIISFMNNEFKKLIRAEIAYEVKENFLLVMLDSNSTITKIINKFQGTINKSSIYPREIIKEINEFDFEYAWDNKKMILNEITKDKCKSVILVHNHPSGNTRPSPSDFDVTKTLRELFDMVDVTLLDHIIITKNSYYSFREEGVL